MGPDDFKVHDIKVSHVQAVDNKGGIGTVKRVTFGIGDHGPFTHDFAESDNAATIKAYITAQQQELQSIADLQG